MTDIDKLNQAASAAKKLAEQNRGVKEIAREAATAPLLKAIKDVQRNSSRQRLLEDGERHRALMRSVEGPLAELRGAGLFDLGSPLQKEIQRAQQIMAEHSERFTLPKLGATQKLVQQFQQSPFAEVMKRYSEQASELKKAMEAMQTPWLDAQRALQSVSGLAEMQGIGGMLSRLPTFDDQVSAALRVDLGDWRDQITWPKNVFTDLGVRSNFYVGLGFDPTLTDFPAPAFAESVEIAGLRREPPQLVEAYGAPVPRSEDDEEEALIRTNFAHDWLLRLETNLRRFIDLQMTRAFGSDWPKHRLPNGLYEQWLQKKQNAENKGRGSWPLVAYADFTDYERLICKKDNWREVFGGYFGRPESVRETFQRLHLIRLDTMHARPIGQDDELLLYVEVKRLIRVIVL